MPAAFQILRRGWCGTREMDKAKTIFQTVSLHGAARVEAQGYSAICGWGFVETLKLGNTFTRRKSPSRSWSGVLASLTAKPSSTPSWAAAQRAWRVSGRGGGLLGEIEPKYCAIAVERMERELSQPCLPTLEPTKATQEVLL